MRQPRLGTLLGRDSRHDNGFNAIRLFAAIAVIFSHAFPIMEVGNGSEPLHRLSAGQATFGVIGVWIFFVLSGLLISASFDRSRSIVDFSVKRGLRIVPALWVSVLLTALVLGPLLTSLPLSRYFANAETLGFLRNLVFAPGGYALGGVFENHPYRAANGALWTLRFELLCYVSAAVLLALGRLRIAAVALLWIMCMGLAAVFPGKPGWMPYLAWMFAQLFRFFGAGMLLYLWRDHIPVGRLAAAVAGLAAAAAISTPMLVPVFAIAGGYAVVAFGLLAPRWFRQIGQTEDYSYGTYVYGFPIAQLLQPLCSEFGAIGWLANFVFTLPLALVAAFLSWRFVERPALQLKPGGKGVARPPRADPRADAGTAASGTAL